MSNFIVYYSSLNILSNQGSNKIRGIMLHSPQRVTVQLHPKAFKRMENLKILMVHNIHIQGEPLKYLPNGLRILKWPEYPFALPSKYCPQQVVIMEMPNSGIRLEKLLKQV